MRFRKKPVVIEAVQWTGDNVDEVATFMGHRRPVHDKALQAVMIETLEGTMTASRGDWIIRGTQGELYPCKPDIFANIYEPEES